MTADSKHCAWAVSGGLIQAWRENGGLKLRSSHDDSATAPVCVMSKEDALELATLL